jgi:hypothetical protein
MITEIVLFNRRSAAGLIARSVLRYSAMLAAAVPAQPSHPGTAAGIVLTINFVL